VSGDPRLTAAEALLAEQCLFGVEVSAEGPQREIAALRVAELQWARLMDDESAILVAGIQALGFRYVALDLLPAAG
jgi:hypothetical protein